MATFQTEALNPLWVTRMSDCYDPACSLVQRILVPTANRLDRSEHDSCHGHDWAALLEIRRWACP